MHDCKVIVKDIFANDETGKSKALNVSQDKTHSAHSRKSADLDVLDYLEKKAAILWPQMCDEEAWVKLEELISFKPFLKVEIKVSMFSLSEREAQIRRPKKRTG